MEDLLPQLMGFGGGRQSNRPPEPIRDTAETVHISPLALLKMLIHGRAGVPLEVMGLMVGEYIDEYTVRVTDVFAIPAVATGQSVEAVDDEYQSQMLVMLEQVGRSEKSVGWYHSHPGFGCWLSQDDINTAKPYEQLNPRSVSVVIDPVQSVPGKVIIDAFRTIPMSSNFGRLNDGPDRETTSNIMFLHPPTIQAILHGLDKLYYNMPVTYRKHPSEIHMLLNVYKKSWREGLAIDRIAKHEKERNESIAVLKNLALQAEMFITTGKDEDDIGNVGKLNPIVHLMQESETLISNNLNQSVGISINGVAF